MKSKVGIIFISIIIALLVILMALLINHLVCQDGDAPQTLIDIDQKASSVYNSAKNSIADFFSYVKYVFIKATAIQTPEYPADYLPLYPDCRVTSYSFNGITNSLNISFGTEDSFNAIYNHYYLLFADDINVNYFKQYKLNDKYLASGMIGNFTFLLEAVPSDNKKYSYEITTQLHYLVGDEFRMENFFRSQKAINSYVFSSPYIYMYQMPEDNDYIYLQLKDYKSQMFALDTHVEMYIDGEFFASRYYGGTIRVPIDTFSKMKNVMMVSFDSNNCIRGVDVMKNTLCYNAEGHEDLYDLASNYSDTENLYIYNSEGLKEISYLQYFKNIKSLYLTGNDKIKNYSCLLGLSSLSKLYLDNVNNEIIYDLNQLNQLEMLQISNCETDIDLGEDFVDLQCKDITLNNCPNLTFDEYGLFSFHLERLAIEYNNSLDSIGFIAAYPNMRIIELSNCDNLSTY